METNKITLTETQFKNLIVGAVKRVLKEYNESDYFNMSSPRTWTIYYEKSLYGVTTGDVATLHVYNQKTEEDAIRYAESTGLQRKNILNVVEGEK